MSAFIVNAESLSRLVYWLAELEHANQSPLMYLKSHRPFNFPATQPERNEAIERAFRSMHQLNVDAVKARYDDRCGEMIPDTYELTWDKGWLSPWQALKSLDCFLYQCCEGDIPERELYQRLDGFRDLVTQVLAQCTPQYEAAAWA